VNLSSKGKYSKHR